MVNGEVACEETYCCRPCHLMGLLEVGAVSRRISCEQQHRHPPLGHGCCTWSVALLSIQTRCSQSNGTRVGGVPSSGSTGWGCLLG